MKKKKGHFSKRRNVYGVSTTRNVCRLDLSPVAADLRNQLISIHVRLFCVWKFIWLSKFYTPESGRKEDTCCT